MHSKLKAEYNCSQEELYSALGTAWGNCAAHLPAFTAHKGFYSTGYIVAARNLLTTAKVLPDDMARAEEARVLRVSLTTLGETSRKNFQKLKSYIVSAYADAEIQKIKFDAAGQKYYARAGREDWESIAMLNQAGDNFITTHLTDLNANNNMPATFPSAFQTDKAAFDLVHDQYKLAEETGEETAAKINANNAIYKLTTDMLADGQLIFANSPEVADLFVFSSILTMISPTASGINGHVKDSVTNQPLSAKISLQIEGEPAFEIICDTDGNFRERLAQDTYTVTASMTGYISKPIVVIIEDGYRGVEIELEGEVASQ